MMISCDKAAAISSKTQYRETSLKERFQLWLHLLACKACASFDRKNKQLTELYQKASRQILSAGEKRAMKKHLARNL